MTQTRKHNRQKVQANRKPQPVPLSNRQQRAINKRIDNSVTDALMRHSLLTSVLGGETRNINVECGYPSSITPQMYRDVYDRQGIGARVVRIFPEECWKYQPDIFESKDTDKTEFEERLSQLEKEKNIFSYLSRIDLLSGIGRYGVLLIGINDGKNLYEPVEGIDLNTGEKTGNQQYELLYLKPFDESVVTIDKKVADQRSPRYGFPELYSIQTSDMNQGATQDKTTLKVHWTRIVHIADNRECSDVYGLPRLQDVYDYCMDVRKVLGGSSEMFWKGGFPGMQFKTFNPSQAGGAAVSVDTEAITTALESYQQSLQRFLIAEGGEFGQLNPNIADPSNHLITNIKAIAMAKGIPYRIFLGSEEAKLASTEDKSTWNGRVAYRQTSYLSPFVIRPVIDRFIVFGILPEVEEYFVEWPDLNTPSEKDKAEVVKAKTDSLAKYVAGNVDQLVPPKEFLMIFMGMTEEETTAIETAASNYESEPDEIDKSEIQPNPDNKETDKSEEK